jgi:hypothetical protein
MRPTETNTEHSQRPIGENMGTRILRPTGEGTEEIERHKGQRDGEIAREHEGCDSDLQGSETLHDIGIREDHPIVHEIIVDLEKDPDKEGEHCLGLRSGFCPL